MAWYDLFKVFTFAFTKDPLEKQTDPRNLPTSGITQPEMPDLRSADSLSNSAGGYIRVQSDLVDLTSTTNRINRYKEYERLVMSVAEIEMAMTVFADEACVAGDTLINTVYHGLKTIEWLATHKKNERFPLYCYDFSKQDYAIGWGYAPRLVKTAPTVQIIMEDGSTEIVTPDHRVLLRNGTWIQAGDLKFGDHLMPFYRLKAHNPNSPTKQFPRIYSHRNGWIHERQLLDEWRLGHELPQYANMNHYAKMIAGGLKMADIERITKLDNQTINSAIRREGFSRQELIRLGQKKDYRRVIGLHPHQAMPVYDLSVETHKNFCTNSMVMHNCQKDEDGRVFKVEVENKDIKEELEFLFFHRTMLNFDQQTMWDKAKRLFIKGDQFWEIVINPEDPKEGVYRVQDLPADTMYRIETTKGKVLEYQQAKEGPDYQALLRAPVHTATESELQSAQAIRFAPEQIIHLRLGDYRKLFYPYGISLIEPARGPAHQLRMMEDAMVVYRLVRAPERRVFYIDIGTLAGFKAQSFMDQLKDQLRKKKTVNNRSVGGASAVEERWHAPSADEDFWLPIRANSNTRIETLPGAQNLGEIDDTVYFRNKLFTALNFPKNYFSLEDPNATRITLSAQDVKFARMIERLQSHIEDALYTVAERHLKLRGFPPEDYEDLKIKMTPPSDWRELSRAEIVTNRINNANSLKGSQLLSDYDILTKWMKYTIDEANEMISRMKVQKMEDLKLQVLAQNPGLLGVGLPGQGEQEMGAEPGGPNPMPAPGQQPPPPGGDMPPDMAGGAPVGPPPGPPMPPPPQQAQAPDTMPAAGQAKPLANPSLEDTIKYDMEIQDYDSEQDVEEIDRTELE